MPRGQTILKIGKVIPKEEKTKRDRYRYSEQHYYLTTLRGIWFSWPFSACRMTFQVIDVPLGGILCQVV